MPLTISRKQRGKVRAEVEAATARAGVEDE
jgi:hypothetical protein